MPSAVVDASVVVPLLLGWIAPRAVGADVADLVSPAHMDAEILNALIGLERRRVIDVPAARTAVGRLGRAPIERAPIESLAGPAWELRHNLSGYDAIYVALARRLRCPLITGDRRLAGAPALGVPVHLIG